MLNISMSEGLQPQVNDEGTTKILNPDSIPEPTVTEPEAPVQLVGSVVDVVGSTMTQTKPPQESGDPDEQSLLNSLREKYPDEIVGPVQQKLQTATPFSEEVTQPVPIVLETKEENSDQNTETSSDFGLTPHEQAFVDRLPSK